MPGKPLSNPQALEYLIKQSRERGRSIVPLVGAGISVDAGVPSLATLARYLAKVHHYVAHTCYELNYDAITRRTQRPPSNLAGATYRYLLEYGWPNPQELDSDLWYWLEEQRIKAPADDSYWRLEDRHWMAMDLLVQQQIVETLKVLDSGFFPLLEECIFDPDPKSAAIPLRSRFWNLTGSYWKDLLAKATRTNPDLVDSLFQQLTRNRKPGLTHRLLAFLTPVLRLRLFLTTNFDSLLEQALRMEDFAPAVFEVTERANLPHPTLLQNEISIIKLHGGAYGLRVERLDTPLDEETKERFRRSLPKKPILMVMGLGGWDQRVLDLIELVEKADGDVLWLHFEDSPPQPIVDRFEGNLFTCHSRNPGGFLRELYQRYKNANPASLLPYRVQEGRAVLDLDQFDELNSRPGTTLKLIKAPNPVGNESLRKTSEDAVRREPAPQFAQLGPVLTSLRLAYQIADLNKPIVAFVDSPEELGLGSSLRLAEFVARKTASHSPVWIDLEVRHNSTEIVIDLLRQLRRYDPGVPPEILPTEEAPFDKIFKRIFATIRRGRYIIAFNGVGSVGRLPTRHDPRDLRGDAVRGDDELSPEHFLCKLIESAVKRTPLSSDTFGSEPALKDSILAFAVDRPLYSLAATRFLETLKRLRGIIPSFEEETWPRTMIWTEELRENSPGVVREDLVLDFAEKVHACVNSTVPGFPLILASFRRRRSLVSLSYVARKVLGSAYSTTQLVTRAIEDARKTLTRPSTSREKQIAIIALTEGGSVWMSRPIRNLIYGEALLRLPATLFLIHREAANYFFDELFLASREVAALMEHFYHQIAACFYLGQLRDQDLGSVQDAHLDRVLGEAQALNKHSDSPAHALELLQLSQLQILLNSLLENEEFLLSSVAHASLELWSRFVLEYELPKIAAPALCADVRHGLQVILLRIRIESLLGSRKCEKLIEEIPSRLPERLLSEFELIGSFNLLSERIAAAIHRTYEDSTEARQLKHLRQASLKSLLSFFFPLVTAYRHLGRFLEARRLLTPPVEALRSVCPRDLAAAEWLAAFLSAQAEVLLQAHCIWKLKGESSTIENADFEHRKKSQLADSEEAVSLCEDALALLAEVHEKNLTLRSTVYSALGRARYLQLNFEAAYRAFDLSRAGLTTKISEKEALAISLLRQCDALLLHSDDQILRQAVSKRVPSSPQEVSPSDALAHISLALIQQELIDDSDGKNGEGDFEFIPTVRSRLALAKDLLERVEAALEGSSRSVHWWSCLYQLRAQAEVERMLLVLTGDLRRADTSSGHDSGTLVYQMQTALRSGLRAVRQGFDVLLRSGKGERTVELLLQDFMILRFVRLWLQLFACGSMLLPIQTAVREVSGARPSNETEQWSTWERLNRRSGFSLLTKCDEVKHWLVNGSFRALLDKHLPVPEPGLRARAATLRIMNQLIADHLEDVVKALCSAD